MPLTSAPADAPTPTPCDRHPELARPDDRLKSLQLEHVQWHVWYVSRGAVKPAFAWHAMPWRFDGLHTGREAFIVHADYDRDLCAEIRSWEATHSDISLALRDHLTEPPDDTGGWTSGECVAQRIAQDTLKADHTALEASGKPTSDTPADKGGTR